MKKLVLALVAYLFVVTTLFSQNVQNCGRIIKKEIIPLPTNGILLPPKLHYDRFDNAYTESELTVNLNLPTCDAGMFKLFFSNDFSTTEQAAICKAFSDISAEIVLLPTYSNATAKIQIIKSNLGANVHAAATPLYAEPNLVCTKNIENNYVWRSLYVKNDSKSDKIYDAVIQFNALYGNEITPKSSNWHTSLTITQPPISYIDLYTVALHEALHTLGFASRISNNGEPNYSYTIWDKQLFAQALGTSGESVIKPNSTPECSGNHQKNDKIKNSKDAFKPCNANNGVVFKGTNIKVYGDDIVGSLTNTISHLCDNNDPMFPSFKFGAIRKNLSADDKTILCKIGYKGKDCEPYACMVQANDDTYIIPQGTSKHPLNATQIKENDYISLNGTPTITFENPNNPTFANGVYTFTLVPGQNVFKYKLTNCDGMGSEASVYISTLPECISEPNACNLVCDGDFEKSTAPTIQAMTNSFRCHKYINNSNEITNENSIELYKNNTDRYVTNTNPPNTVFTNNLISGGFWTEIFSDYPKLFCLPQTNPKTPFGFINSLNYSIPSITPNSKFVHLGMNNYNIGADNDYFEAVLLQLNNTLIPGQEYEIAFDKFSGCNHSVNFSFSNNLPCNMFINDAGLYPALFENTPVDCKDINGDPITFAVPQTVTVSYQSDLTAGTDFYSANWSTASGIKFIASNQAKYLIVWISPDPDPNNSGNGGGKSLFLDNIVVSPILVSPTVTSKILQNCDKDQVTIEYEVCFPANKTTPYTANLLVTLPNGLAFNTAGSFPNGSISINVPVGKKLCQKLTLVLDVQNNIALGNPLPIDLKISSPTLCIPPNIHTVLYTPTISLSGLLSKTYLYQNFPKGYTGQLGTTLSVPDDLIIDVDYNFDGIAFEAQSAVKILINENITATFDKCQFYTCDDQMWQGIEVLSPTKGAVGGKIVMTNCPRVMDAHNAIKLNNSTAAIITGNTFISNYMSVYAKNAILTEFSAKYNTHQGAKLKNLYLGQPTLLQKHDNSYAAYWFENVSYNIFAPIFVGDLNSNTVSSEFISDMSYGIYAYNTSLYTSGVYFKNIQEGFINVGIAIYAYADALDTKMLIVSGVGKDAILFENCTYGVLANNVRLYVLSNKMINTKVGIWGDFIVNGIIRDNHLECNSCIAIYQTESYNILENDIFSTNGQNTADFGVWVNACGNIKIDDKILIENNKINLNKALYGILVTDSENTSIRNNQDITMQGNSSSGFVDGINLTNSEFCSVIQNNVKGVALLPATNGIFIQNSSDNTFCCNNLDNTNTGVEVRAINNNENTFFTTTFGEHSKGLWLRQFSPNDPEPIIGGQAHSGNKWEGKMKIGAQNDAFDFKKIDNLPFLMEDLVGVQPLSHPIILTPNAPGADWFKQADGTSIICNNTGSCFSMKPPPDNKVDRLVLDEETSASLNEITKWQLSKNLYAKLSANPSLINSENAISDFYEQTNGTAIANFVGIAEGLSYTKSYKTAAHTTIEKEIKANETALIAIEKKIATSEENEALLEERNAIYEAIAALSAKVSEEIALVQNDKIEMLQTLKQRNDAIFTGAIYEENLKKVNKVQINQLLAKGNKLSNEDIALLESVAYQCDMQGGEAVQTARAMLTWFDMKKYHFKRENGCQTEIYTKSQKSNSSDIRIYPNPSDGNIVVDCGSLTTTQLNIFDVNGKVVLSQNINDKRTPINISHLSNGIYYCRLLGNENAIKFTIIH